MSTVQKIVLGLVSVFAGAILGSVVIGVIANTVASGDIAVPNATNNTVTALLTSYNTLIQSATSPIGIIISLVIVVVLVVIFFKDGLSGKGGGSTIV